MQELIGTIIDRKYRIKRLLGEGGMGAVFEAEHTRIERKVAVKILHSQYSSSEELVGRFFREAQAASAIGHPNIIDIFDVGVQEDGTVFIVMELLKGESLGDWMKREDAKNPGRAVAVVLQVLSALTVAHDKGIIHRDLKPDNTFIAKDSRGRYEVKLLDFGIAKIQDDAEGDTGLTKTGTVLGTPNYMSPEQARGKDVDQRIDIWSVGVMLYQMLAGELPFKGDSYNAVLSDILLETPTPLMKATKGVPGDLAKVVEKAMAKNRNERYRYVSDMARDLMPFSDETEDFMTADAASALRKSMAPPPPRGEKTVTAKSTPTRFGQKRSRTRAVWLVVVLLLACVVGLFLFSTDSSKPLSQRGEAFTKNAVSFWSRSEVKDDVLEASDEVLETISEIQPLQVGGGDPVLEVPDAALGTEVKVLGDTATDTASAGESPDTETIAAKTPREPEVLPEKVTIRFEGLPKKARLFKKGKRVKPPLKLRGSKKPVGLKATLRNHKPFVTEIVPDRDQTVEVVFEKKGRKK